MTDCGGLEGVPGLPGAPQDEAGLTRKFETSHVGGSPWVGPGKPNLPLGLRGKAGGGARVTAGRVATREESGVLGFPSRRGLTPRGSLECNPEIPAFPGEENYSPRSRKESDTTEQLN